MSWEAFTLEFRILAFVLGAMVGSFLNVCIHRIPLGESIVSPGSRCPRCERAIRAWQNVPILSWFFLRGRCASCEAPISARYPFVEGLNAGAWLLVAWWLGPNVTSVIVMIFVSAMIALFYTDWDHQLLPDRITFPLFALGVVVAPFNPLLDLAPGPLGAGTALSRVGAALAGAAIGYGLFALLVITWRVLFAKDAMGGGDLKMMLGVGAFLGIPGVATTVLLASIVGTLLSVPFLLFGRWSMSRELPFGCFLAPAAAISALWGHDFVVWYLGLLVI